MVLRNRSLITIGIITILLVSMIAIASGATDSKYAHSKVNLHASGITATDKTRVNLTGGEMTFTDIKSGMSIKTKIKIDGALFTPDTSTNVGGEVKLNLNKKATIGKTGKSTIKPIETLKPVNTPDAEFSYIYTEKTIKETIVLQQDMDLSFPVTISAGQKLIPWGYRGVKIVNANNGDTMTGIEAGIPYGVDAEGRYVWMNYTWDGSELHLNYNRTLAIINPELSTPLNPVFDYVPISYPLTIDPTWTAVGDHWVTTDGEYTVIKWNATGTTNWAVPVGVSSIDYLIVAAGGDGGQYLGGGGGAGGMYAGTGVAVTGGSTITVKVGQHGVTGCGSGGTSQLGAAIVDGGGCGGDFGTHLAANGGSGGGGHYYEGGKSGEGGVGHDGGDGYGYLYAGPESGGGGGGGAGETGHTGAILAGGNGGFGLSSSITGVSQYYAGGGGGEGYGAAGGTGGSGGGGTGENTGVGPSSAVAAIETDYGGGGAATSSGTVAFGGNGVVIVRYLGPSSPVASFTVDHNEGEADLDVSFIDTSTHDPTAWNWSYRNVTGNDTEQWFSQLEYPAFTFGAGNWSIKLNASNSDGSNISSLSTFINITRHIPYTYADFTSANSGILSLQFTDTSTGDKPPDSWAWLFGDETYTQAWTEQTSSPGWSARSDAASVVMGDGSIVIMGGSNTNDVWISRNKGVTWTRQTASAGWSARRGLRAVPLIDHVGFIMMMGGIDAGGNQLNDVWISGDYGATWSEVTVHANWSARYGHTALQLNDGSILVMGGSSGGVSKNDVWRSTNYGHDWTELVATSPKWSARMWHTSIRMPDNSIVLMGGYPYNNEVWRSTNGGIDWTEKSSGAGWSSRDLLTSVAMPDEGILAIGGETSGPGYSKEVWWSSLFDDYGTNWVKLPDAAWNARGGLFSAALPDGSVLIMGGNDGGDMNDVWRFNPVGSSIQNPLHHYASAITYIVTLQTSNLKGVSIAAQSVHPATVTGAVMIGGYVKDAESTNVIPGATIVVSQGSSNTVVSDSDGYYITTTSSFVANTPTTIRATASGHQTYQHEFNTAETGLIPINLTLLSLTPSHSGTASLGGIARTLPYNRTIDAATISIQGSDIPVNNTVYIVTTNSAGYYIQDNMDADYWWNVTGSKLGYGNITYRKFVAGAPI